MDSTDTLPNIRQLLSSSCVQLRTSFIGFNSSQRDSNPSRHVSRSTEANQNESSKSFFKLRNKKFFYEYNEAIKYGRGDKIQKSPKGGGGYYKFDHTRPYLITS